LYLPDSPDGAIETGGRDHLLRVLSGNHTGGWCTKFGGKMEDFAVRERKVDGAEIAFVSQVPALSFPQHP